MDMDDRPSYTCITCAVGFKDADTQRQHYKTDWHRYNLKRKVAEMAPVTLEDFDRRKNAHEAQMKVINGEVKEPTGYCVSCRKHFGNQKAYTNHLQSKKHRETLAKFELKDDKEEIEKNRKNRQPSESSSAVVEDDADEDIEEVDSDEWDEEMEGDPIPETDCLFCTQHSSTLEKNLAHMTDKHSFFIPDPDYLVDLEGLVKYLGAKVGQGHMCLWCNERGKAFFSLDAVQKHMNDKGHCKLLHEGSALIEYADYYDYSTSYPEGDGEDKDEEVELDQLDDSGYELVLPSGATVGHRSLMRYYRQSLNPNRSVVPQRSAKEKVLSQYKAIGWTGLSGADAKMKAKDIKFMRKVQQKYYMKLGCSANKMQRHFRDPTITW